MTENTIEYNDIYEKALVIYETSVEEAKEDRFGRNDAKILAKQAVYAKFPFLEYDDKEDAMSGRNAYFWSRTGAILDKYYPRVFDAITVADDKNRIFSRPNITALYKILAEDGVIPNNRIMNAVAEWAGFAPYTASATMSALKNNKNYTVVEHDLWFEVKKQKSQRQLLIEKFEDEACRLVCQAKQLQEKIDFLKKNEE